MNHKRIKILRFMLTLAMILCMMPGMSAATVYVSGQVRVSDLQVGDIIKSSCQIYKNSGRGLTILNEDGSTYATYGTSGFVSNVQPGFVTICNKAAASLQDTAIIQGYTPVDVTGISLDKTTLELELGGGTGTLTAAVLPENATDTGITWSSSNTSVATVNNGIVTPLSVGSATITATSHWDNTKTASCEVSVIQIETYTITIPSTLTVSNSGWNILEGGISADLNLETGKKLIITASSDTGFNFVKSGDTSAKVAYYFLESGDTSTTYNADNAQTSWEFSESEQKNIGIVIEDYSEKPAGTYKETVTFTASVEQN